MDLEQYRRSSHEIWQQMAAGWDSRRDWMWAVSRQVSEWMVAKLDPRPGQTILELAAGTGETGFAAASRLGDDGRLIATDFAPQMVEAAKRRANELALSNVEFRVMDAERMDLDDDSVDGVLCRWGYMLMGEPAAALSQTRRVLRGGGRVALSVWGAAEDNPWAALGRRALEERGHMRPPQPGDPGIFALGNEERLREVVTGAGFGSVEIEPVAVEYRFDDFDDYWRFLREVAGAVEMAIRQLSEDERAQARELTQQDVEPFRASDGTYVMPGVALNAVAS